MDESGAVQAQEVSGTPSFMAPEQILIKQYRLTAATDLYALGALLYRCLTGLSPHGEGGADYRRQVIEKLQARDVANSLAKAAMMIWRDLAAPQREKRVGSLLRRALEQAPDNVFGWYLASIYCDTNVGVATACALPDAPAQLTRLDADNGFAWVLLAMRSDGDAAWAALHSAATSDEFHDYFGASYGSYAKAIESVGVEPPGLAAGVARALAPGASVSSTVAEYEVWAVPPAEWLPENPETLLLPEERTPAQ